MSSFEKVVAAQEENILVRADKMVGKDVPFERTRRITGYLVGDLKRFNNAKRAEERDRVKHDTAN